VFEKRYVIFISDQFGYRSGGSNTVNIELCIALKQIARGEDEIVSLVINCEDGCRIKALEERAQELRIQLVHQNILEKEISEKECDEICRRIFGYENEEGWKNAVWIGHDIFTGHHAIRLARFTKSISVAVIHTDYDTIEGLKGVNNQGFVKEGNQRWIIEQADKVFAVGPRLMERVREIRESEIYELIPGLSFFQENQIFNNRAIITYGRFEETVAQVKQVRLVLAAFGRAVDIMNNNRDYVLHIIGTADREEEKRLRGIAEEYANGRRLSINFLNYTQDRKRLYSYLKNNCAGLMVSISEGFGMTGWEMISAGIPLILTKKSGLYDYLVSRFGFRMNGLCLPVDLKGSSDQHLCREDVETVAGRIVTVFRNTKELREAASELKELLRDDTWYKAAERLAGGIGLPIENSGSAQIYSATYRTRKACIEELLNELELRPDKRRFLIFFGGISSALCRERAIRKIDRWLQEDPKRKLFLCYESGNAASERAKDLDARKLPQDGLPGDPKERMIAKEKMVVESVKRYSQQVQRRIVLIRLENQPLTYSIVSGRDIYFTVLLETRSSESMTMKIRDDSTAEKRKIIASMEYIIQKQKTGGEEEELLDILRQLQTADFWRQ